MRRKRAQHIIISRISATLVLACFLFTLLSTMFLGKGWGRSAVFELVDQSTESDSSKGSEVNLLDDYHLSNSTLYHTLLHDDKELLYLILAEPLPSFPHLSRNIPPPEFRNVL